MDIKHINAQGNNITHTIQIIKLIKQLKDLPLVADFKETEQYMQLLQLITSLTNIYALADKKTVNTEQEVAAPMIVDTERFGLSIPIFTSFERCIMYTQKNDTQEPTFFIKATELTDDKYKSIFTYAKEHGVDTLLINDGTESLPLNLKEILAVLEASNNDNKYKDDLTRNKECNYYEVGTWFVDSIVFKFGPLKKIDVEMSWDFIIAGTVLFKQYFVSMTTKDGKSINIADQNTFNTIQFLKTVNNTDYAYIEILGVGDFFGGKINYRVAGPKDIDVMIINPSITSVSDDDEFDTWSIKNFMNIIEHRANYTYSTRSALRFFAMFKDKHNSTQIEDITANARYLNTLSNIGVTNDVIEKLLGDNDWIDKNSNETKSSASGQEPSSVGDNETLINKTKIQCFACGTEWEFDDSKIPTGERYEVTCPKCQMKLRRKKV